MAAKHDNDVEDVREAFVRQLAQKLERLHTRAPRSAMLVKDKQQLLAQLKKRLEATAAARETAIEHYDAEIRRRQSAIDRLEEEIRQYERGSSPDGAKSRRTR